MNLRLILLPALALGLVLAPLGCGGANVPDAPTSPARPQLPAGEVSVSNAGGFHAIWRAIEGEVPLNEEFTAEVWLFEDEDGARPIENAAVVIDCRMPAHRHGMLTDVDLVHQGGGRYLAEGMMCHMLGHWELYVDLTRGLITERAQWDLELE